MERPDYTRRLARPESVDDYVLRFQGYDVGSCSLERFAGNVKKWRWSMYFGAAHCPRRRLETVALDGVADTLEEAQQQFKSCHEKYMAAGVCKTPEEARRAPF